MNSIKIIEVTSKNVDQEGVYCIKDFSAPGFKTKAGWFKCKTNEGVKIFIAKDEDDKQLGFIEYTPSENAWRPVKAENYLFIQCIGIFVKDARNKNVASTLIKYCERDVRALNKSGLCTMSSDGVWMANKSIFLKNGFTMTEKLGRFELLVKSFDERATQPVFIDWPENQKNYKGFHLLYSDQCPWHYKAVNEIKKSAEEKGIKIKIKKIKTPGEAQNSPSGFGTFSLMKNGKLLADHYISKTRFDNILKKELN